MKRSAIRLALLASACLAATVLAAPSAAASELDLTMSFSPAGAPYVGDQQPIDQQFTMTLSYSFDPHVWTGVQLTLTLPNKVTHPRIAIGAIAEPPNTFSSGVVVAGATDTIVWTGTPAANTGISGQIVVTLTAESWGNGVFGPAIDGTPYGFTATLTGIADGGPTPASATATGTRVGVGKANIQWQYPGSLYGGYESMPNETSAGRGVLFRFNFRYTNCGSNPIDPNHTVTVDLGSGLQLARHWSGDNNGIYPTSYLALPFEGPLSPPGTNGEIWSATPGTPAQVSVNHPYAMGGPPACDYSNNYYIELWASCASLDALRQARQSQGDLSPWQFQGRVDALEPHFGQASTAATAPLTSGIQTLPDASCGDFQPLDKAYDHNPPASVNFVSLGANKLWYVNFGLPLGVSAVDDFLFVDVLPMRGTDTIFTRGADFLASLNAYFCTLTPGLYFEPADVPGFISSGQCKPAVTYATYYWRADPSQPIAQVSHFILYGDYTVTGDTGFHHNWIYEYSTVPADLDVSVGPDFNILRNRAYITGKADLDLDAGTPDQVFGDDLVEVGSEDNFEDAGSVRVVDYACPQSFFHTGYFGPQTISPGDCSWTHAMVYSSQPYRASKNMTLQVQAPEGAIVTDVEFAFGTSPCTENPDVGVFEPQPPFESPLVWELGAPGEDCTQPYDDGPLHFRVHFCADANHAFENGETLDFSIDILDYTYYPVAPDTCSGYTQHHTASFTMLVPAEMSETVAPLCRADGGISFQASALNTGGVDLQQLVPMFTLPRSATGSGADAVFAGITNIETGGQPYVIEGSSDGVAWTPAPTPGDASIRYVRLRGTAANGLEIGAVTGSPIRYDVLVTTSGGSGVELFGGGTLDGATATGSLATANAAANQPYVIDGCKVLTVTKFFDADRDGFDDGVLAGEPKLAGWTFVATNEDGAEVATATTNDAGVASFLLTVGDYAITEHHQSTPPSTWSVTTPADAIDDQATNVTLTLAMSSLGIVFGNDCECPNADGNLCTGRCLPNGTCDDAYRVQCVDDTSCSADACNPATGLCQFTFKDCTAVDYYLPVEDGQGNAAGTIHCVLEPGQDPRCDEENGELIVWPLGTTTMQSCDNR